LLIAYTASVNQFILAYSVFLTYNSLLSTVKVASPNQSPRVVPATHEHAPAVTLRPFPPAVRSESAVNHKVRGGIAEGSSRTDTVASKIPTTAEEFLAQAAATHGSAGNAGNAGSAGNTTPQSASVMVPVPIAAPVRQHSMTDSVSSVDLVNQQMLTSEGACPESEERVEERFEKELGIAAKDHRISASLGGDGGGDVKLKHHDLAQLLARSDLSANIEIVKIKHELMKLKNLLLEQQVPPGSPTAYGALTFSLVINSFFLFFFLFPNQLFNSFFVL
jgi:hypothetical protein